MHQDPFVSTGGLSFHPPTPSNIIASKSRDGIYRSPLSLSTKVLLEFLKFLLLPEKRNKTRWTADEERKEGKGREKEGKGE